VADCGIHDAHVLALDVEELALDAQGHVLNLDHEFLSLLLMTSFDEFDLIEADFGILIFNKLLNLVHLFGFRDLFGVGEDETGQILAI